MSHAPARRYGRVLAWVGGAVVVAAALWTLRGQWSAAVAVAGTVHPDWAPVLVASAIVLAAYGVLILTWRRTVTDAGTALSVGDSANIWFVSNLARYIPGALWQMGALAVLAKQRGASASAATSAAVVLTVVNTLCGLAIAIAFGSELSATPIVPWIPVAFGVAGLAALRWLAPPLVARLAARTGIDFKLPRLSDRALLIAIAGSAASWIAYGVAFDLIVAGTVPEVRLSLSAAIAIYCASYLAGFLSLGPPAGLGVADGAMIWLLTAGGIAAPAQAVVIAAITRLWRTALEIAPGLVALAVQRTRGSRIP